MRRLCRLWQINTPILPTHSRPCTESLHTWLSHLEHSTRPPNRCEMLNFVSLRRDSHWQVNLQVNLSRFWTQPVKYRSCKYSLGHSVQMWVCDYWMARYSQQSHNSRVHIRRHTREVDSPRTEIQSRSRIVYKIAPSRLDRKIEYLGHHWHPSQGMPIAEGAWQQMCHKYVKEPREPSCRYQHFQIGHWFLHLKSWWAGQYLMRLNHL